MFYNFKKNKKAFTLVELIVVIAIIAILGAVVGVTVSSFVDKARVSAAESPLKDLKGYWDGAIAEGQTLSQFVATYFKDDTGNFSCSSDAWGTKVSKLGTVNIYYHENDGATGDYYGKLEIKSGTPDAVTSSKTAPTNTVAYK